MSREWQPGDVATIPGIGVAIRGLGGRWFGLAGQLRASLIGHHPLVVIDPEDAEQVERLVTLYCNQFPIARGPEDDLAMAEALREFADPKPDEPTGLGAVVRDADGRSWVRTSEDVFPWHFSDRDEVGDRYTDSCTYADIDAVEVLSEGVIA